MAATHMDVCRYRLARVGTGLVQFGLWTDEGRCLLESAILLSGDGALRAIDRTRGASRRDDRYWWRIARDLRQQIVLLDDDGLFLCASPRSASRPSLEADLLLMQRWGPTAALCIAPAEHGTVLAGGSSSPARSGPERRQPSGLSRGDSGVD